MSHHTSDPQCPLCTEKLGLAHPALAHWFDAIKAKFPDAHISWTFRDEAAQNQFFEQHKTRARWPHSAHNKQPAQAMDLFQIRADLVAAWPEPWFRQIADYLDSCDAPMVWGGTWKSIGDGDHFQLRETT